MSKLIERAKAILLTPRTEWPVIAAEPDTTAGLYKNYIAILAAIGPIASLLGTMLFMSALGFAFSAGFITVLLTYLLTLAAVYVFAADHQRAGADLRRTEGSAPGAQDGRVRDDAFVHRGRRTAHAVPRDADHAGWRRLRRLPPLPGSAAHDEGAAGKGRGLHGGRPDRRSWSSPGSARCSSSALMGRGMWGGYGGPTVTIGDRDVVKDGSVAALEEWAKQMEAAGKQVEASAQQNQGAPSAAAVGALIGATVGGRPGRDGPARGPAQVIPARVARGPAAHRAFRRAECRNGL